MAVARRVYDQRNRRLEAMTDESVDLFYSCLLCQSFAPNHVCIITPERLGLCGAYNWLDGKAAFEIDPTGPNQPVKKGECLDPVKGIWTGITDYVYTNSHKTVETFCAYSIMDRPMTSCGCFEVIVAYVPECNGVMIVNREFLGETPVGMTFSALAGSVGGGQQTPGFMGCGKVFLSSRKFLFAEGGHKRIVWMPKGLKQLLGEDLKKRFAAAGEPDLLDKIADETIVTDANELRAFMEKVGHPALTMPDMHSYTQSAVAQPTAGQGSAAGSSLGGAPGATQGATGSSPASVSGATLGATGGLPASAVGAAPASSAGVPAAPGGTAAASLGAMPGAPSERSESRGDGRADLTGDAAMTPEQFEKLKTQIAAQVTAELKTTLSQQIVREIVAMLGERLPGQLAPGATGILPASAVGATPSVDTSSRGVVVPRTPTPEPRTPAVLASARIAAIAKVPIRRQKAEVAIHTVTLGASRSEGGTRGRTYTIGGATAMPFHHWEGEMPHRSLVAMEVFDSVSPKYPPVLREIYGDLLDKPAEMAKVCVDKYGADLISVRLEGTHPEKGDRSPEQSLELVKSVLAAVDVPLIVTGHNHFDKINAVMKAVAQGCAGERLLLNWAETDNYRTIAGAALAYGHCIVAQTPIDVNMAKQLNILLGNMDVKPHQIVMDPMTGTMGYGIEYTYSVMERIRLTALGGDRMLAGTMILAPGQECAKIKELKATAAEFPAWGDLGRRAAVWELSTAVSFLYAGADVLIMYHPQAAMAAKKTIAKLMDEN
jgi:CO dehydrogenase/acetyl-CoA synthase delta subunit